MSNAVADAVAIGDYFSLNVADLAIVLWHLWSLSGNGDRAHLAHIIQVADVEHQVWALQHWMMEAPERTQSVTDWVDKQQRHQPVVPLLLKWNDLAEHMREHPGDVTVALLWMRHEIRLNRGVVSDALGLAAALDLPQPEQQFRRLRLWAEGSVRRIGLLQQWMQHVELQ